MASLYRQKGRDGKPARIWWVKYSQNGRVIRESTRTDDERKARQVLKEREGRVVAGLPVLPRADRIRYAEAAADLRQHYKTTGSRNPVEAEKRFKHLDAYFIGQRLAGIGGAEATAYVAQ